MFLRTLMRPTERSTWRGTKFLVTIREELRPANNHTCELQTGSAPAGLSDEAAAPAHSVTATSWARTLSQNYVAKLFPDSQPAETMGWCLLSLVIRP